MSTARIRWFVNRYFSYDNGTNWSSAGRKAAPSEQAAKDFALRYVRGGAHRIGLVITAKGRTAGRYISTAVRLGPGYKAVWQTPEEMGQRRVIFSDIVWETDGAPAPPDTLTLTIPKDTDLDEDGAELLSEETGFLVQSFNYQVVGVE